MFIIETAFGLASNKETQQSRAKAGHARLNSALFALINRKQPHAKIFNLELYGDNQS